MIFAPELRYRAAATLAPHHLHIRSFIAFEGGHLARVNAQITDPKLWVEVCLGVDKVEAQP